MDYLFIPKEKAVQCGLNPLWTRDAGDGRVVATDRQVLDLPSMEGTLEERAQALGAEIHDCETTLKILKES